jgi:hypothetical protein
MNLNDVLNFISMAPGNQKRAIEIVLNLHQNKQLNAQTFINDVLPVTSTPGWFNYMRKALKNRLFYRLKFSITELPTPLFQQAVKVLTAHDCMFCRELYNAEGKPVKLLIEYSKTGIVCEEDIMFVRRSLYYFEMVIKNHPKSYYGYCMNDNMID